MQQIGQGVVYRHFRMEKLADTLIKNLRGEISGDSLFHSVSIIVPNKNTARYLTERTAENCGIAAGIRYPFLMSLFQPQNYDGLEFPEWDVTVNAQTIAWRIYRELPGLLDRLEFTHLKKWLDGKGEQHLYHLSSKLGQLYDRYMLYRPDWIVDWENRSCFAPEEWQGSLWQILAGDDWKGHHFAALQQKITAGEVSLKSKDPVRVFGFSMIPPAVLACLDQFSQDHSVELYHFVPSREFFGNLKSRKSEWKMLNSLVKAYSGRDRAPTEFLNIMKDYCFQHNALVSSFAMQARNLLNATIEWTEGQVSEDGELPEETVLQKLQKQIITDENVPEKEDRIMPCRSIQFRSCYSPFREVEAARNFILHCLEEKPELNLRDFLIMTPDPDLFAPFVNAVFNDMTQEGKLSVSIADKSPGTDYPSFRAFLKILSLYKGNFTESEIFSILQTPSIRKNLGFSAEDCKFCLDRTIAAGIRWGWDASAHEAKGGVRFSEASWQAGLDRMLLNYAMECDPFVPHQTEKDSVFAVPGFAGSNGILLGKFADFVFQLHETAQKFRRTCETGLPLSKWIPALRETAENFFGGDSDLIQPLMKGLQTMEYELRMAKSEEVLLPGEVILEKMKEFSESKKDNAKGFLRGSITFCGLRPMRDIPAKVILLLGMDHNAFPSSEPKLDFDLMQEKPQEGDPSLRDDERQLFLDMILSAGDYLYISYVGRNQHDRKEYPPSACVDELRNYLKETFGAHSFVSIEEPLQAFSAELFRDGTPNQSYSGTLCRIAEKINHRTSAEKMPQFQLERLTDPLPPEYYHASVADLIFFFLNPVKKFLSFRMGTGLSPDEEKATEDCESFNPKEYFDFDLKEELYELCLKAGNRDELKQRCLKRMKADSLISLTADAGTEQWDEIENMAQSVLSQTEKGTECVLPARQELFSLKNGETFTLDIPECKVLSIPDREERILLMPFFVKELDATCAIKKTIHQLAVNLQQPVRFQIISPGPPLLEPGINPEKAKQRLTEIIELYLEGLQEPLAFFPQTSYELVRDSSEKEAPVERAKAKWAKKDSEKYEAFFGSAFPDLEKIQKTARRFFGTEENK